MIRQAINWYPKHPRFNGKSILMAFNMANSMKRYSSYPFATIVLLTVMISPSINGQLSNFGNWFIYLGNQKISPRISIWNEVQYRNYNTLGDLEQLLIRSGLGYDLGEGKANILCGYGYIYSHPYSQKGLEERTDITEHRLWQQVISRQNFGPLAIQHRYRFEERFIGDNYRFRFRYFLGLNLPLNKPTMESKAVYLSLYNEIFIHSHGEIFDRDRIYGGIGYVFNRYLRMETAVMNQIYQSHFRPQFQIALFNNLPLFKS